MKRRDFLKSTAAVAGASMASRLGFAKNVAEPGPQPNILFILVDELRWPSVFPKGINNAEGYFKRFMPNLYKGIWKKGVKFGGYYTAADACTPARSTIISGLYTHQNWMVTTILNTPNVPVLNPAFPTYGKLLQVAGYKTPYFGKWHVSVPTNTDNLAQYGFQWNSYPDPTGSNLQGTYGDDSATPPYHNDAYTANQAVNYLKTVKPNDAPWCLTVGFVNPHDREFFPAGTEFQTMTNVFANPRLNPQGLKQNVDYSVSGPQVPWDQDKLKSPPSFGFPFSRPTGKHRQSGKHRRNPPHRPSFVTSSSWSGEAPQTIPFSSASVSYPTATTIPVMGSAELLSITGSEDSTVTPRSPRFSTTRLALFSINSTKLHRASSITPSSSSPQIMANTAEPMACSRVS